MSFPTFLNIDSLVNEAKDYLETEITFGRKVKPIFTVCKIDQKLLTVKLPLVDSYDQRLETLTQLSWLSTSLGTDCLLFAIDSSLTLPNDKGELIDQDVFLVFYSNKMGAMLTPLFYSFDPELNKFQWIDKKIDEKIITDTQKRIILFLGSQFFFPPYSHPWKEYVKYLDSKGFEFVYHHPFSELIVEYAQDCLYSP